MLSDSQTLLLLRLRLALLSLVHSAADAEERLSSEARRLRWAVRDRIDASSAIVPAASVLVRGSIWMLSICVQALKGLLSLLPMANLQRRWRAAAAAQKTVAAPSSTSNSKKQPRGRPPPRPATEAAVILAEADEAELPLSRVADVLEWCALLRESEAREMRTSKDTFLLNLAPPPPPIKKKTNLVGAPNRASSAFSSSTPPGTSSGGPRS